MFHDLGRCFSVIEMECILGRIGQYKAVLKMNDSNELVKVISDDTYVFSFLLYFYVSGRCTGPMCMNSPKVVQAVVDMKAAAEKQPSTSKFILPLRIL